MTRQTVNNFFLLLICITVASCTGTRRLPPGEKLYKGASVELQPVEKIENKGKIIREAKTAIRPKPNKGFLGMRPKLVLNNMAGDTTGKKKFRKWLKRQGEPPVLMSEVKPAQTVKYIDAKLFNIGIFNSTTQYKVIEKKRTVRVVYTCRVHNPYKIKEIKNEILNDAIRQLVAQEPEKTFVKPGDDYSLDNLKKERDRIDGVLKDNGYYFFNPDYLIFKADTSETDKTVSMRLRMKEDVPVKALVVYKINQVTIDPNYSLERNDSVKRDTIMVEGVVFMHKQTRIKPRILLQSVYLKKSDVYSRKRHNITLNRLMTIGMYKYVRVKFTEVDSGIINTEGNNLLDMAIYLTPMQKRTLRAEANIISKSNDFIGPQLNINYRNRNVFRGAELLSLNLGGSFETQIVGQYKDLYSYSINPQVELYFPRFIVPFRIKKTNSYYVPKTRFSIGYSYVKRIAYFDMRSLQFIYGFKWKETAKKEHELNPVSVNYTSVNNISSEFNELLLSNPFIKRSYENQLIAGATYSFTYNEQIIPELKNQFYFNFYSEIAGNMLSFGELIAGRRSSEENPLEIAGTPYSQFAKASVDVRNYSNFEASKFVLRLFAGVAKAYGNSSTLPYIKQFFSGGPYSVRAFVINSLGPGTYEQRTKDRSVFIQQGGDIKLETNAEYRFDIVSYFKGALFVDAGNVWLMRSNPALVTSPFSFTTFYKEIAVGAGFGIRIDVKFFVLRFDLATPLRKPWLPEDQRWVFNKIALGSSSWRSDNLILNVAIGYPF